MKNQCFCSSPQIALSTAKLTLEMTNLASKTARLAPKTAKLAPKTAKLTPKTAKLAPKMAKLAPKMAHLTPKTAKRLPTWRPRRPSWFSRWRSCAQDGQVGAQDGQVGVQDGEVGQQTSSSMKLFQTCRLNATMKQCNAVVNETNPNLLQIQQNANAIKRHRRQNESKTSARATKLQCQQEIDVDGIDGSTLVLIYLLISLRNGRNLWAFGVPGPV